MITPRSNVYFAALDPEDADVVQRGCGLLAGVQWSGRARVFPRSYPDSQITQAIKRSVRHDADDGVGS